MNRICQFWVTMEKMMLLRRLLKQKTRLLKILTTYTMLTNPGSFRQLKIPGNTSQAKGHVAILITDKIYKAIKPANAVF